MSDHYITVDNHFYAQSGFAFPSTTFEDNGIPIVRMSDLKDGQLRFENTKYVGESWLNLANEYLLKENDFLLGMSGSLSNYAVVTKDKIPAFLNQRVARLKSKTSEHSYEYVAYWLKSHFYLQYAEIQGEGAAQKNISAKQIGLFRYRNASKLEQFKIVKILSAIDQAIEKTEALIEKYQQIKAGLMNDLFTRGIGEDGKLRPPREQAPELYQETPIGWIPKDWDYMSCDDCIELLTDYHANGAYEILKIHVELLDYPDFAVMIRTTNFEQNDFERDVKYISKHAYSFLSKSSVQPNDILMNKIANPGVTYLMPDLGVRVSLGMNLFLLRLKNGFSPEFIQAYLKYREDYVKTFSNGTGTKTITKDAVRSLIVVMPKKADEVTKITNSLTKLNKKINIENEHLIRVKNIKDGLMHDLLTGKTQVFINATEAAHV